MATGRILLVEDEPDIAEILQYNLEKEGFEVDVEPRGDSALERIRASAPDLLLLDLMLPGLDGLELARLLQRDRRTASLPLIMLTARGEEVDRIVGLELGADDYVTKPFSPRELVARLRAVLRRAEGGVAAAAERPRTVGPLTLDPGRRSVTVADVPVQLTSTEFDLLAHLAGRPGRVFTREELLSAVWGYASHSGTRTVDVHVAQVRAKLGAAGTLIRTHRGVGYACDD
jgi:DNA-binding response OmpR family regulator